MFLYLSLPLGFYCFMHWWWKLYSYRNVCFKSDILTSETELLLPCLQNCLQQSYAFNCSMFCMCTRSGSPHNVIHSSSKLLEYTNLVLWTRLLQTSWQQTLFPWSNKPEWGYDWSRDCKTTGDNIAMGTQGIQARASLAHEHQDRGVITVQTNKPAMALVTHLKMTGKTVKYDQEHKIQRLEGCCWEADSLDTENDWVMDMYLEAETFCWI